MVPNAFAMPCTSAARLPETSSRFAFDLASEKVALTVCCVRPLRPIADGGLNQP
jgi:hypothetical protein